MKDYKFDYGNDSFRIDRGLDGDRYFIKVNDDYIEKELNIDSLVDALKNEPDLLNQLLSALKQ